MTNPVGQEQLEPVRLVPDSKHKDLQFLVSQGLETAWIQEEQHKIFYLLAVN